MAVGTAGTLDLTYDNKPLPDVSNAHGMTHALLDDARDCQRQGTLAVPPHAHAKGEHQAGRGCVQVLHMCKPASTRFNGDVFLR